ncbi:MAG: POTRA domain-containing protein [Chitinophagaceae bacterium]|jgi:outer membrane protein assembly factor BamA
MMQLRKYFSLLIFLFTPVLLVYAQDKEEEVYQDNAILQSSKVVIRNIIISGNKKTKNYIIGREITFKKGAAYSISEILSGVQTSRQNLMNTALFVDATVNFTNWISDSLDIYADVKERWYFFPLPYLKPIDRNLNVWIKDYDLSLDRVNYGMKFIGQNITGRNDRLNAWLINGYTQRAALRYYNPFSDNSLRHGWGFDFSYSRNRELNYDTKNNKQVFFKDPSKFIREQFYAGGLYSYRKGSIVRHYVRLGVQGESIADTVARLNPNYLGGSKRRVAYPELRYTYQYFDLNYIPYPTRGTSIEIDFLKRGFGKNVNLTQLQLRFGKYFTLPNKFYISSFAEGNIKLPFDQPFFNQSLLGYNESFMRGLEYYVVDGVAGGYIRNTIGKEIAAVRFNTGLRSKTYNSIPFRFYLKAYGDAGYIYNKNNLMTNSLNNRLIYSGGIGLDIISIYDIVLRVEYSFNQKGENGLFIHKADVRN